MRYIVTYVLRKEKKTKSYSNCHDAGSAFAQCQKEFPGARMVKAAGVGGGATGLEGVITYAPLPVQRDPLPKVRPARPLRPNERDSLMPFYDEVKGSKR